jgi:hypothetical protein
MQTTSEHEFAMPFGNGISAATSAFELVATTLKNWEINAFLSVIDVFLLNSLSLILNSNSYVKII